jgi:hypothetical protein
MKPEIRILGIDDSHFDKFNDHECRVIGVLFRGGSFLDGVMSTTVTVDGDDSTSKLAIMINSSKFKRMIRCVMLDGIAVAGFNIVDIVALNKKTNLPIVVVMRRIPDLKKIRETLNNLNMSAKISLLERAGHIERIRDLYVQYVGINSVELEEILRISISHAQIPEALRVAHLIGAGISLGESK